MIRKRPSISHATTLEQRAWVDYRGVRRTNHFWRHGR